MFLLLGFTAADHRVAGVEALVWWRHPELGRLPPTEFIPLAETGHLIHASTTWATEAMDRLRTRLGDGHDLTMAASLSHPHSPGS